MADMSMRQSLARKLNVRSAALMIAAMMVLFGCLMVKQGLRDDGAIDIRSPFLSGQVKSGFVGVLLVFMGMVITTTVVLRHRPPSTPRQSIKVRNGSRSLEWDGDLYYWNERRNILDLIAMMTEGAFGVPDSSRSKSDTGDSNSSATGK
jgi:hypothetical protein